jgi:hypothetical protein
MQPRKRMFASEIVIPVVALADLGVALSAQDGSP